MDKNLNRIGWMVIAFSILFTVTSINKAYASPTSSRLQKRLKFDARLRVYPSHYKLDDAGKLNKLRFLDKKTQDAFKKGWEIRWDRRSDRPHLIQGVGVPILPVARRTLEPRYMKTIGSLEHLTTEDIGRVFDSILQQYSSLLGVNNLELKRNDRTTSIDPNRKVWSIEYQQYEKDIPVESTAVIFRINNGRLIQFGTYKIGDISIETDPSINSEDALLEALYNLDVDRFEISLFGNANLKIITTSTNLSNDKPGKKYNGEDGMGYNHVLVWEYILSDIDEEHPYKLWIDAHNGEIVKLEDMLRSATVEGRVFPESSADALQNVNFPYTEVQNNGTKVTDSNGSYSYSSGASSCDLSGKYIEIIDNCGTISRSGDASGNIDFEGATGTDCTTPSVGGSGNTNSSRTAFYHLTKLNRKLEDKYFANHSWLNGTLTIETNLTTDTCNAFWHPPSGRIWTMRSGGGCNNSGEISDILYHEFGHGLDDNTGGFADFGTGEAFGDTIAFLENRNGCMGENFRTTSCDNCRSTCTGVRDVEAFATNSISTIASPSEIEDNNGINCDRFACPYFWGTTPYQGPMGYEGHCESYVASTANWDLAKRLLKAFGADEGWKKMENLWYASVISAQDAYEVVSGGTCNPSATVDGCAINNWYTVYLSKDDDNGNLNDGTPNGCKIWDAFNDHGIACDDRPYCTWDPSYIIPIVNPLI